MPEELPRHAASARVQMGFGDHIVGTITIEARHAA